MNTFIYRLTRRKEKIINIYRIAVCGFAVICIALCGAYKAGNFFTAENLRDITLSDRAVLKLVPAKEKSYTPKNESFYNEELYLIEEDASKEENQVQLQSGQYPIVSVDMSGGASAGEVLVNDSDSGASVDISAALSSPLPDSLKSEGVSTLSARQKPLVLIIHTHATECYSREGADSYSDGTSFRTEDKSQNMVAVGKVLCDTLNKNGISAIHCETLHDAEDYNSSYPNSLESVKYYLEKYPSIKYVFDLHRDAIIRENGELIKTEFSKDGKSCAQIMTLVGTNSAGADHPYWRDNFNLAVKLNNLLSTEYTGITRPINLRGASFNQQYAPGSLLFEMGSCGNTLEEAKTAAVYLGEAIAKIIKGT